MHDPQLLLNLSVCSAAQSLVYFGFVFLFIRNRKRIIHRTSVKHFGMSHDDQTVVLMKWCRICVLREPVICTVYSSSWHDISSLREASSQPLLVNVQNVFKKICKYVCDGLASWLSFKPAFRIVYRVSCWLSEILWVYTVVVTEGGWNIFQILFESVLKKYHISQDQNKDYKWEEDHLVRFVGGR